MHKAKLHRKIKVHNPPPTPPSQQTAYLPPEVLREVTYHPLENVLGDPRAGVRTRSGFIKVVAHCAFLSQTETKTLFESGPGLYFSYPRGTCTVRAKPWTLVPRPRDRVLIGTKWVYRNKLY